MYNFLNEYKIEIILYNCIINLRALQRYTIKSKNNHIKTEKILDQIIM